MTKFTKIFLFGGLGCVGVGMITLLISGSIGGSEALKRAARSNITLGQHGPVIGFDFDDDDFHHDTEGMISFANGERYSYDIDDVKELSLNIDAGKVDMETYTGDEILVEVDGIFHAKQKLENGKLMIDGELEDHIINTNVGTLVIRIPKDKTFDFVDIRIGGGTIDVEKLTAIKTKIDLAAGELDMESLDTEDCDISIAMGEMDITGNVQKNLDLDCGMGTIDVTLTGLNENDYNYDIACSAGEVSIGNNVHVGGVGMNKRIDNDSDRNINIKCGMGEVDVEFE